MEEEIQTFEVDLTGDDGIQDIDVELPQENEDSMYVALPEEAKEEIVEDDLLIAETELSEAHQVEKLPSTADEQTETSDADFFDQPVIVDERQKVVESIEGMTEVAEEPEAETSAIEEVPTKEVDLLPAEKVPSIRGARRRTSGTIASFESLESNMTRESISRKFTILYPEQVRITGWESEVDDLMMGFEMLKEPQLMLDEIVEEEERVEEEVEEPEPTLDRTPYYAKHDEASQQIAQRKIRSFILQKKLTMYLKRKKMDYATRESDWSLTQQMKYNRKLETWHEFILFEDHEREHSNLEIGISRQEREERSVKLQNMFKQMQARERETGCGLIYKKSGNVIPDKLVDRLINRQKNQMKEVCTMRLNYIKLKQVLHEKLTIIDHLDEVSPGFLLANYEQLKVLNQSYADKIEERDEELTRLRSKCANTIQILAHIREKSMALDSDVKDLEDELADTESEFSRVRTELNELKQQRDTFRHKIVKIRNESGLLTKPTLLRDMREELDNSKDLAQHLEACKQTNQKLSKRVKTIRSKIEEAKDTMRKTPSTSKRLLKKDSSFATASNTKQILYRGRPSLIMPFIDPSAFDCLKSIKPQVTYDRRVHNVKCISKTK